VKITAKIILPALGLHLYYTRTLTALLQNLHSPTYITAISPVPVPYIVGLIITVKLVIDFQVPKVTVPIIVTHVPRNTVKTKAQKAIQTVASQAPSSQ